MPEAPAHVGSGKVRELYALDDERLLLVASDRISTFDVVLPTEIPDKGRVLTGLSAFWFARTEQVVPNHLLGLRPDGRSTECRRLEMLPIECVVRGYLSGSGWKDYLATGAVCGHVLPTGLRESDRLPTASGSARSGSNACRPRWPQLRIAAPLRRRERRRPAHENRATPRRSRTRRRASRRARRGRRGEAARSRAEGRSPLPRAGSRPSPG